MRQISVCASVGLALLAAGCSGSSTPASPSTAPAAQTRIIAMSGNLAFGNVTVGQKTSATFTISNSGNSVLNISGLSVPTGTTAVYSASWTSGAIAPGGSQVVTVFFAPTTTQSYNGVLTAVGDQTSGVNTLAISGTGLVPIGTFSWSANGTLEFCSSTLCLDYVGSAVNNGTGCATDVWFHVEFYTQEFGPFLPDILVFPADSTPSPTLVRPGQRFSFKTGAVFNSSGRHVTASLITTHYTPVSCS